MSLYWSLREIICFGMWERENARAQRFVLWRGVGTELGCKDLPCHVGHAPRLGTVIYTLIVKVLIRFLLTMPGTESLWNTDSRIIRPISRGFPLTLRRHNPCLWRLGSPGCCRKVRRFSAWALRWGRWWDHRSTPCSWWGSTDCTPRRRWVASRSLRKQ